MEGPTNQTQVKGNALTLPQVTMSQPKVLPIRLSARLGHISHLLVNGPAKMLNLVIMLMM
jgi:hypothetical protein